MSSCGINKVRVAKRTATEAIKISASRRPPNEASPLPRWIPPQLCQFVETAPSGPQWLHEIKLDGFRMSAPIERGRVQLLTRTGLDWSDKYPSVVEALANVRAKSAYLDGELCGQHELFADTGRKRWLTRGLSRLFRFRSPASRRPRHREPASHGAQGAARSLVAAIPGLQFNGHETATES